MVLIIGLPNAGKTTFSAKFPKVVHFDSIKGRGIERFNNVVSMVSEDNSLCVEGVYEKARERTSLVKASKEMNTCIWLDTPVDICVQRERYGRNRSEHIVVWAAERFEPPTFAEGWDEIIIIRGEHDVQSYRREEQD